MYNLYGNHLAQVYDEIYQGFINYKAEYGFYKKICVNLKASRILEIACGSGNLSKPFSKDFTCYIGLDYSEAMLKIAKQRFFKGNFYLADMRNFKVPEKIDTVLITGRSTSYLLNNEDLESTFKAIHNTLETTGHLVFDTIDAALFMPYISKNKYVTHISNKNNKTFQRDSHWVIEPSLKYNLINWKAEYFKIEESKKISLGTDISVFRSFTSTEIKAALKKTNFKILGIKKRSTYAFETHVFICQKLQ